VTESNLEAGQARKLVIVLWTLGFTFSTDYFKLRFKGAVPMKLIEGFDSNYRYILVAARRARQLQSGAPPVVDTNSRKPCRIAQDEIRAGKVKWEMTEIRSAAELAAEALDKATSQD
jgi:DNA-directed RNA polymerase subunit omega